MLTMNLTCRHSLTRINCRLTCKHNYRQYLPPYGLPRFSIVPVHLASCPSEDDPPLGNADSEKRTNYLSTVALTMPGYTTNPKCFVMALGPFKDSNAYVYQVLRTTYSIVLFNMFVRYPWASFLTTSSSSLLSAKTG